MRKRKPSSSDTLVGFLRGQITLTELHETEDRDILETEKALRESLSQHHVPHLVERSGRKRK